MEQVEKAISLNIVIIAELFIDQLLAWPFKERSKLV